MTESFEMARAVDSDITAANVDKLVSLLPTFNTVASRFARFQHNIDRPDESVKELRQKTLSAMLDLYLAGNNTDKQTEFTNQYGDESARFRQLFGMIQLPHESLKIEGMSDRNKIKTILTAVWYARSYPKLAPAVLEVAGYDKTAIRKAIATMAVYGIAATGMTVVGLGAVAGAQATHDARIFHILPTNANVDISYALNFLTAFVANREAILAHRNPRLGISNNPGAMVATMLTRKLFPNNPRLRSIIDYMGAYLPWITGLPAITATLALPHGHEAVTAINWATSLGQLAFAGGLRVVRAKKGS